MAKGVVEQLIQFGETRRGWLGVRIQNVDETIAESLGLGTARGRRGTAIASGVRSAASRDIILASKAGWTFGSIGADGINSGGGAEMRVPGTRAGAIVAGLVETDRLASSAANRPIALTIRAAAKTQVLRLETTCPTSGLVCRVGNGDGSCPAGSVIIFWSDRHGRFFYRCGTPDGCGRGRL
jgi:S1-C subfamily serine protease